MKLSYYIDEDAQDADLIHALRLHGIDVIGSWEAGMRQRDDEEHLVYAATQRRVLYGFNVRDYFRIHSQFITQGKTHAGIILAKQQTYSVGEQMRRLLRLSASKSAEKMENQIEFLSDWGDEDRDDE
jgi:hypothetical protein